LNYDSYLIFRPRDRTQNLKGLAFVNRKKGLTKRQTFLSIYSHYIYISIRGISDNPKVLTQRILRLRL